MNITVSCQVLRFDSPAGGLEIFFFTMSRTALGSTQPPIQWGFFPWGKAAGALS